MQINKKGFDLAGGGANKLNPDIPYGAGWAMETILTFALVFMVYAATDSVRGSNTAHIPVSVCSRRLTTLSHFGYKSMNDRFLLFINAQHTQGNLLEMK